jgi:CRP-like cAMP-binding protein
VELCQAGTNGRRFATVVALEDSVLADIPNDAFLAFVEGLGSRMAKKVSRYMADLVLAQVISHEAEASRDDRRRCARPLASHSSSRSCT